jgi:hypothetical protein
MQLLATLLGRGALVLLASAWPRRIAATWLHMQLAQLATMPRHSLLCTPVARLTCSHELGRLPIILARQPEITGLR